MIAAPLILFGLWQLDRLGSEEVVDAQVVATRIWSHRGADGRMHTHQRVTIEIEGLVRATVDRGDDLQPDQIVPVRVRRSRWTGRPRFLGLEPVEGEVGDEPPADGLTPLEEPD